MALSWENVKIAFALFARIGGKISHTFVQEADKENQYDTGKVLGTGRMSSSGWENIWINIKDITPAQKKIWEEDKGMVANSSFCDKLDDGITRIGFF